MSPIRVKFISKTAPEEITRLWKPLLDIAKLPDNMTVTFDPDATSYDYLIVYEDLPPRPGERKKILRTETLACARQNTLLITTEPSSIRIDGPHYLKQFGAVWSSKPDSLMLDIQRPLFTPPLRYFYGRNLAGGPHRTLGGPIADKSQDLSVICSNKAMKRTLHAKRLQFVLAIKEQLGDELTVYGRGFRPVDDKAEAMDDYRYHLAIENHVQSGHLTEKLIDCFLAGCLPFYYGDPDYNGYFPKEAVIPINIDDLDGSVAIIREAIARDEYSKRLPAIKEARKRALTSWNTVKAACWIAQQRYEAGWTPGGVIHGRHAFRRAHPVNAIRDAIFMARMRKSVHAEPVQLC